MTVDRYIHIIAGTFILLSLAFGVSGSPLFMSQWWLAFTSFVGADLFQFGFTNLGPLGRMVQELGGPRSNGACQR